MPSAKKNLPYNAAVYNTGQSAASFTSTALDVVTNAERALISEEDYMLVVKRIKIKGYASIQTNFGNINVELYTDYAPRTVYNFVKLSQQGYYKNTIFHRNVRNFMLQGGDPTGTGRGGESYWKKEFLDEFNSPYKHDARGILSMANKGRNTNSSQLYHLTNKQLMVASLPIDQYLILIGSIQCSERLLVAWRFLINSKRYPQIMTRNRHKTSKSTTSLSSWILSR